MNARRAVLILLVLTLALPTVISIDFCILFIERFTDLRGWRSTLAGGTIAGMTVALMLWGHPVILGWVAAVVSGLPGGLMRLLQTPILCIHITHTKDIPTTCRYIVYAILILFYYIVVFVCLYIQFVFSNAITIALIVAMMMCLE